MLKRSRNLLFIVATVIIIVVGFVLIGNIVYPSIYEYKYPQSKLKLKSDAEVIAQFQTRKTELNQLLQQIYQTEKELQPLKDEVNKKIKIFQEELEKNEEINKDNPQLKEKERIRLRNELGYPRQPLMKISAEKLFTLQRETNKLGFVLLSLQDPTGDFKVEPEIRFGLRNNDYQFDKEHLWGSKLERYFIEKGFVAFTKNNQPDQHLVVDSLDNYSSGNIKFIAQKFIAKFGKNDTIYVHIQGNWYLFLKVIMKLDYDPNDF